MYNKLKRQFTMRHRSLLPQRVLPRFLSSIRYTKKCWYWTKHLTNGYGYICIGGKYMKAQRFSYELFRGKIQKGLVTDHLCKNRCCVNPFHLEVVTQKENILRGSSHPALNARKTHCQKGHEFTIENTKPNKNGRTCRTCYNSYMKIYNRKPERVIKIKRYKQIAQAIENQDEG